MTYSIYLFLGVFAGTLSGLFGIGGGLVIVPTLLFCFKYLGFSPEIAIHMAIGTSLSIIVVTATNSVYGHQKRKGIDWQVFKKIFFPLIIGTYFGGMISSKLSASFLEIVFSVYVVLVSIKMFLDVKVDKVQKETSLILYSFVGALIGFKSAILGIGGGTISIPFLSWRGFSMKKAVGVSAALGLPISIVGSISYIVSGLKVQGLPEHSLGYIYLPAFIGVIITSSFFAHIGAKLSHKLPQQKMKKGFAIFLSIVAIKMIFFS
ncbi:sulfite exporter TauE/SafE family protein [Halobacteriovorax marinus]|uniref:sulfite exporter TauE/SafE family protein n=1 Tax=Halobacteriovorax marinus TaxID=97084 RepID=UPI003A901CF5